MHTDKVPVFGVRHIQTVFLFFLTTLAYATRANLSLAIVAMTKKSSENPDVPIYDWDTKSLILSSFYWTYFIPQVIAGRLSQKYGAKVFLMTAMFVNTVACILTPPIAAYGTYGVIICRLLQGLSQGFFYPICYDIMAAWSPISERATMVSIVVTGNSVGTIICTPFVGFISTSWIGWPASFYVLGSVCFIWMVLYFFFGADNPRKHRSISEEEIAYIGSSDSQEDKSKVYDVPWKAIFTSMPFWAILVTFIGRSWYVAIVYTEIPNYMDKVLKFNIEANALITASPYIFCIIIGFGTGPLSSFMIRRNWITLLGARKLFTILGCAIPTASLLMLGYMSEDQKAIAVTMLIIAIGFSCFANAGSLMNHIDIAPNQAGVLMGITNGASCALIPLPPLVIQYTIIDEGNISQWRTHFITSAALLIFSTIFYLIYAAADVQWWNSSESKYGEERKTTVDVIP